MQAHGKLNQQPDPLTISLLTDFWLDLFNRALLQFVTWLLVCASGSKREG